MHSHYSFQTECISLLNYTFVKFKLNLIKHTAIHVYKNLTCVLPEKKNYALHRKFPGGEARGLKSPTIFLNKEPHLIIGISRGVGRGTELKTCVTFLKRLCQ